MYRKIINYLSQWNKSQTDRPLIIHGIRGIGKTYTTLNFANEVYGNNIVYINFEDHPEHENALLLQQSSDQLYSYISSLSDYTRNEKIYMIIFDEIQACVNPIELLKKIGNFKASNPIIILSSLFGDIIQSSEFQPIKNQFEIKMMYPMDMEEYLYELGESNLVTQIKNSYNNNTPLPNPVHKKALMLFRHYLFVGGMPECIRSINNENPFLINHIQQKNLTLLDSDLQKQLLIKDYKKAKSIINNMPEQMSKQSSKFQLKLVKKNIRASEYWKVYNFLTLSGVLLKVGNKDNSDSSKTFLYDFGLLNSLKSVPVEKIIDEPDTLGYYKGNLTENYVVSQLLSNNVKTCFWESARGAEIDFVVFINGSYIPVEVKNADNKRARALNIYVQKMNPKYAIKLSKNNFNFENGIKTVPVYAAFCIKD